MLGVALKIFRRVSAAVAESITILSMRWSSVPSSAVGRTAFAPSCEVGDSGRDICALFVRRSTSAYDTIARAPALSGPSHILTFVVEPLAVLLPHLLKPLQHQTHHAWCVFPAILPIERFSIAILELRRTS